MKRGIVEGKIAGEIQRAALAEVRARARDLISDPEARSTSALSVTAGEIFDDSFVQMCKKIWLEANVIEGQANVDFYDGWTGDVRELAGH